MKSKKIVYDEAVSALGGLDLIVNIAENYVTTTDRKVQVKFKMPDILIEIFKL